MKTKQSRRLRSVKHSNKLENTLVVSNPELVKIEGRMSKFNDHITHISEMVSSMEDSRKSKPTFDTRSEVK